MKDEKEEDTVLEKQLLPERINCAKAPLSCLRTPWLKTHVSVVTVYVQIPIFVKVKNKKQTQNTTGPRL